MEECRPDPNPSTNKGVCIKKSTDPLAIKQLDELTKKVVINEGIKEGEVCTKGITKCEIPLYCDGICKKTWNLISKVSGNRIPPPPGDPNCRDALDSNENDETNSKCIEIEELCNKIIYIQLMREQCPKTCGYCDNPELILYDEISNENNEDKSYDESSEDNDKRINNKIK
ncbi:ShKT domain-containing protein [Meloidogyne graminicola]|uniref:ShKT domain-containing protein n=1 Tax=Meloidogyne graminicola TaxID=189291 RepID=A0A8T0A1P8_9BILA|nr:ShKT domain-containing protein [Meloidogyne graminicola]